MRFGVELEDSFVILLDLLLLFGIIFTDKKEIKMSNQNNKLDVQKLVEENKKLKSKIDRIKALINQALCLRA